MSVSALAISISLASVLAETPAALLDRDAALRHAGAIAKEAPLRAAEIRMLLGDPRGALAVLEGLDPAAVPGTDGAARLLRLRADAHLALGDDLLATRELSYLAAHPGWTAHGYRSRPPWRHGSPLRRGVANTGVALFALAFAILIVLGARELLRVRLETVVVLAATMLALVILRFTAPGLAGPVGLVGLASAALGHAGAAAIDRALPGPRLRLIVATIVALGVAGAVAGALALLPVRALLSIDHPDRVQTD